MKIKINDTRKLTKEEFVLSEKFTDERRKINAEINDERVIVHCHTTLNKLEDDVKEFIRRLKQISEDKFIERGQFNRKYHDEEIDKLSGKNLL